MFYTISMLIFFYGADDFRSSQKTAEIKEKFLKGDPAGTGLSVFDFEQQDRNRKGNADMINTLETSNLLAPKRLVIIRSIISCGQEESRKKCWEFLEKNCGRLQRDADLVVVFWEGSVPKKTDALYKFLEKNAKKQNFEKLTGPKLANWILAGIKELDAKAEISKAALDKLVVYAGNDTRVLDAEIQKLVNFADGKMIQDSDVDVLVKANLDSNIFGMIDALAANNKKDAFRLLHLNLEQGEDPFYILSMFVYQFRNLLKVADLKEKLGSREQEIAKMTKLHPFVVKKSLQQVRNFSQEQLKNIYHKLEELDVKSKTGKMEIKLALDLFVAEL